MHFLRRNKQKDYKGSFDFLKFWQMRIDNVSGWQQPKIFQTFWTQMHFHSTDKKKNSFYFNPKLPFFLFFENEETKKK